MHELQSSEGQKWPKWDAHGSWPHSLWQHEEHSRLGRFKRQAAAPVSWGGLWMCFYVPTDPKVVFPATRGHCSTQFTGNNAALLLRLLRMCPQTKSEEKMPKRCWLWSTVWSMKKSSASVRTSLSGRFTVLMFDKSQRPYVVAWGKHPLHFHTAVFYRKQ